MTETITPYVAEGRPQQKAVLCLGSLDTGWRFVGPFDSARLAYLWRDHRGYTDADSHVSELEPTEDGFEGIPAPDVDIPPTRCPYCSHIGVNLVDKADDLSRYQCDACTRSFKA